MKATLLLLVFISSLAYAQDENLTLIADKNRLVYDIKLGGETYQYVVDVTNDGKWLTLDGKIQGDTKRVLSTGMMGTLAADYNYYGDSIAIPGSEQNNEVYILINKKNFKKLLKLKSGKTIPLSIHGKTYAVSANGTDSFSFQTDQGTGYTEALYTSFEENDTYGSLVIGVNNNQLIILEASLGNVFSMRLSSVTKNK